ncbi:hypothetical protein MTO96_031082 [Rhipicephalus appendiculatus]
MRAEYHFQTRLAWQKAAGLYKTCISFVEANRTETEDLAIWMKSMDLDFNKQKILFTIDPCGYHHQRLSRLGSPRYTFLAPDEYLVLPSKEGYLASIQHSRKKLAKQSSTFTGEGQQVRNILNEHYPDLPFDVDIGELHKFTRPFVTRERWVNAISKYTNGTYTAGDKIMVQQPSLNVLVDILNDTIGENGLRYLVAWSIYRQLVEYTVPDMLTKGRTASDACYKHASKTMHLALLSSYFQAVVKPSMVEAVRTMLSNIREAFREEFESSSWVTGDDRSVVIRKLAYMTTHVGSAGGRLDHDYLERLYKSYPDVPPDRLFPSWIKALSLSSHYNWADTTTWRYDETQVNAFYEYRTNLLVIPTAIITRPVYYDGGPPAFNYGALGAIVGHEMMHAYDVAGKEYNDMAELLPWASTAFTREYAERVMCIRRSHRDAIRPQARQAVRDPRDAENLAGLCGRKTGVQGLLFIVPPRAEDHIGRPQHIG